MCHAAGFQLVDGKERIIAVEGLAGGAMQAVQDIALHSLDGTLPQPPNTRLRAVHWHQGIRQDLQSDPADNGSTSEISHNALHSLHSVQCTSGQN